MKFFVEAEVIASVRQRYGMPVRVFAEKVKEEPETIKDWEKNGVELSTSKMELLASTISCHWSVLLRDEPLPVVEKPKSKRTASGRSSTLPETSTLITYREAYRLLSNIFISDLPKLRSSFQELIKLAKSDSPEDVAKSFRDAIQYDESKRHGLRDQRAVYRYMVDKLEKNGIFVSEQKLNTDDIKGFLISKDSTYLIVVSSLDKFPASRLFTLLHEAGHILRGSASSACDLRQVNGNLAKVDDEEKFCDSFAAAVLMPRDEFKNDSRTVSVAKKLDNEALSKVATSYRTSYLAVVRRLYTLEMITYSEYRKKTKEFYDVIFPKILSNMKRPKNSVIKLPKSFYVNREIKKASKSYTDFVINKYSIGDIGSGEAKRLLGVDTKYLIEIEKVVGAGR